MDRLWLASPAGDERAVIRIDVPRSLFVHESPGGYVHRFADSTRRTSPEFLARLFQSSARLSGREPEYYLIDDPGLVLTIHAAVP